VDAVLRGGDHVELALLALDHQLVEKNARA